MQRPLFTFAALAVLAGTAAAQSAVSIYGVLDANARNVSNSGSGSTHSLSTDGISSSRLGFQGIEDLGGGLNARFRLEAAVSPDSGTTQQRFWHRESWVSLGGRFGDVRLGRDYTPSAWNHTDFDPFNATGVGNSKNISNLNSVIPTYTRADNSIGYLLPRDLGGLYGQAMYAFGENAPGKHLGARIGWLSGPLNVAVGWGRTDMGTSRDQKGTVLSSGITYSFAPVKLYFQHNRDVSDNGPAVDRKDSRWLVGAMLPIASTAVLKVSYGRTDQSGTAAQDAADARQIAVGVQYNLSTRTALYANHARLENKGGGVMKIPGGGDITPGGSSKATEFGLRHRF